MPDGSCFSRNVFLVTIKLLFLQIFSPRVRVRCELQTVLTQTRRFIRVQTNKWDWVKIKNRRILKGTWEFYCEKLFFSCFCDFRCVFLDLRAARPCRTSEDSARVSVLTASKYLASSTWRTQRLGCPSAPRALFMKGLLCSWTFAVWWSFNVASNLPVFGLLAKYLGAWSLFASNRSSLNWPHVGLKPGLVSDLKLKRRILVDLFVIWIVCFSSAQGTKKTFGCFLFLNFYLKRQFQTREITFSSKTNAERWAAAKEAYYFRLKLL